jgi:predicted transcriptional regulator of viral defense system
VLIVRRRELLAAGYEPDEVRQRLRTGELVKIRPGAYVGDALPRAPEERHRLAVRAAVPDLAAEAVISHVSAAVLWGVPTWGIALDRVHATRPRRSGARRGRVVHLHAAPLDPEEIAQVDGITVTAPARTVVDIARSVPFERAVVLADRALHSGLVHADDLAAALASAAHRPGSPAARRALHFADGRSESVGESRSRTAIAAAGLPVPVLQWDVRTPAGTWLGRTDFGWPDRGVVGEFDGRIKYSRELHPHVEAGDVVFAEKRREDALREAGLRVVRWIWSDLDDFTPTADRLRRALGIPTSAARTPR